MTTRVHGLMRRAVGLKRRGLLAGAAAVIGAGLAKLGTPERTEAGHAAPEDVFHVDVVNTTSFSTIISGSVSGAPVLMGGHGTSTFLGRQDGVQGLTTT